MSPRANASYPALTIAAPEPSSASMLRIPSRSSADSACPCALIACSTAVRRTSSCSPLIVNVQLLSLGISRQSATLRMASLLRVASPCACGGRPCRGVPADQRRPGRAGLPWSERVSRPAARPAPLPARSSARTGADALRSRRCRQTRRREADPGPLVCPYRLRNAPRTSVPADKRTTSGEGPPARSLSSRPGSGRAPGRRTAARPAAPARRPRGTSRRSPGRPGAAAARSRTRGCRAG